MSLGGPTTCGSITSPGVQARLVPANPVTPAAAPAAPAAPAAADIAPAAPEPGKGDLIDTSA